MNVKSLNFKKEEKKIEVEEL